MDFDLDFGSYVPSVKTVVTNGRRRQIRIEAEPIDDLFKPNLSSGTALETSQSSIFNARQPTTTISSQFERKESISSETGPKGDAGSQEISTKHASSFLDPPQESPKKEFERADFEVDAKDKSEQIFTESDFKTTPKQKLVESPKQDTALSVNLEREMGKLFEAMEQRLNTSMQREIKDLNDQLSMEIERYIKPNEQMKTELLEACEAVKKVVENVKNDRETSEVLSTSKLENQMKEMKTQMEYKHGDVMDQLKKQCSKLNRDIISQINSKKSNVNEDRAFKMVGDIEERHNQETRVLFDQLNRCLKWCENMTTQSSNESSTFARLRRVYEENEEKRLRLGEERDNLLLSTMNNYFTQLERHQTRFLAAQEDMMKLVHNQSNVGSLNLMKQKERLENISANDDEIKSKADERSLFLLANELKDRSIELENMCQVVCHVKDQVVTAIQLLKGLNVTHGYILSQTNEEKRSFPAQELQPKSVSRDDQNYVHSQKIILNPKTSWWDDTVENDKVALANEKLYLKQITSRN